MKNTYWVVLCAFLLFVLGAGYCTAQTTGGTLRGTVTDPAGLPVGGAKVGITSQQTNVTISLSSTVDGAYNYPDLLVGKYTVTVEKEGFQKYVRSDIQVFANQITSVDVALQVGQITTTVEVTGGAPLIETGTSQISNDFTGEQVTQLPNQDPGGSQLYLALLAPGATGQQAGVTGEGGSIGGTRPRFNSFTIDGVDDNRIDVNGHTQYVIPQSVSDFNLLTNQFSAEYGHSAGGQFNTVTKSGTNGWHGGAWEFNNNRNYDAYTNLQKIPVAGVVPPKPRSDFNRFGGQIGGPIIQNKLFIYGAYQRIVQGLASEGTGQSTPTAAGLATLKSTTDTAVQAILAQFPVATASNGTEPVTTGPGTPCASPGPGLVGCQIPVGTISPQAPNFLNQWDFIVNGDAILGKHSLAFHVLYDRQRSPNVNATTPLPQFAGSIEEDARKYLFKDTWIISNVFINQFSAGFSRFVQTYTVPGTFANFPNAEIDNMNLNIGPQGCSPQSTVINTYQFVDSMSYVVRKHTLKWGATWNHWIAPSNFLPRARGEWDYANLNELANDVVPTGTNGALRGAGSGFFAGNQNGFNLFFQDDWKVTRKLTANMGVRYEWNGVPRDDSLQKLNSIATCLGCVVPGRGPGAFIFGQPKSDWNNVAPRLGLAYDPTGSGKWAIRAGFGISYDVTPQNFVTLSLPPELQTEQNPVLTCGLAGAPAWCPDFTGGSGLGHGFLQGGGLLQVNVPCDSQLVCRQSTGALIVDNVEPEVLTWSLGVQHDLGWNSSVEVRYVGTRSLNLPVQARLNIQTGFDAGLKALPEYFTTGAVPAAVPTPAVRLFDWDAFEGNAFQPTSVSPSGCVDPSPFAYGQEGFCGSLVTGFPTYGSGTYNGVSIDFDHRVGHGLTFMANYTYSRNYDNGTNELFTSFVNPRRSQDWRHISPDDWGPSTLDVPSKLALSWVYDLPNNHGDNAFVRGFANGWQWGGTWLAYNGTPGTILNGADANGDFFNTGDRPMFNRAGTKTNFASAANVQVDYVCNDGAGGATRIVPFTALDQNTGLVDGCGNSDDKNIVGYVAHDPTAKYVTAGLGTRSNMGRVGFRTPGMNVWNMNVQKTTKVGERVSVAFAVSAYNVFNHPNPALAQPDVFQAANGSLVNTVNNALSTSYNNIQAQGSGPNTFLNTSQFSGGSRILRFGIEVNF